MILDVINMLWIGDALSPIEQLSIQSYMKQGHPVHLYTYDAVKNVPPGTVVKDASTIIAADQVFKHANSYAAFADMFRWKLMDLGLGYWSDTDVVCLKPFKHDKSVVVGRESEYLLTPTILKGTEAHSRLATDMYAISQRPLEFLPQDTLKRRIKKMLGLAQKYVLQQPVHAVGWVETAGPDGLTKYYYYYEKELDVEVLAPEVWYPITWTEWYKIVKPGMFSLEEFREETLAVHLWNEMWARNGVDKWQPFPKGSLIREMMTLYGVT